MMQDFDRAIADYDEAVRLEPEDFFARWFRGDAHLAVASYDLAVADWTRPPFSTWATPGF